MKTNYKSISSDLLSKIRAQFGGKSSSEEAIDLEVLEHTPSTYGNFLTQKLAHDGRFKPVSGLSPLGTFDGRPIIGPGSRIHGGVFLDATQQDSVVIDEGYGNLNRIYRKLILEFINRFGTVDPNLFAQNFLLPTAKRIAEDSLPITSEKLLEQLRKQEGVANLNKVALDLYIQFACGSFRHRSLLFAYLIEKLIDNKILKGKLDIYPASCSESGRTEVHFIPDQGKPFVYIAESSRIR